MNETKKKSDYSDNIIKKLGLKCLEGESGYLGKIRTSSIGVCHRLRCLKANNTVYYLLNREKPINYLHWLEPDDTHILCDGGPVKYYVFHPDGSVKRYLLSKNILEEPPETDLEPRPVLTIPGGCWKALELCKEEDKDEYVEFALMANVLTPEFTKDRVKIGAGLRFIDKYAGKADWATPEFLLKLIGPNFRWGVSSTIFSN